MPPSSDQGIPHQDVLWQKACQALTLTILDEHNDRGCGLYTFRVLDDMSSLAQQKREQCQLHDGVGKPMRDLPCLVNVTTEGVVRTPSEFLMMQVALLNKKENNVNCMME